MPRRERCTGAFAVLLVVLVGLQMERERWVDKCNRHCGEASTDVVTRDRQEWLTALGCLSLCMTHKAMSDYMYPSEITSRGKQKRR